MSDRLEFLMPDVGEGIARAELLEWFVPVGEPVSAHQPLCQVETDKSLVEIPAPETGIVVAHGVEVGEQAVVGHVLAVIAVESGAHVSAVPPDPTPAAAPSRRPMASPHTRRLAVQRGIELATIEGTGPYGRILESDLDVIETEAPSVAAGRAPDEVVQLHGVRQSIARSMTEALAIPHITEFREVDASRLLQARESLSASVSPDDGRMSVLPLLLMAVIRALRLQPSLNGTFDAAAGAFTRRGDISLGIATATPDGLIVPVIKDADRLGLGELVTGLNQQVARARERNASAGELTGGSFTVTNFGSFGTWLGSPVIRPPEVGIAGFGRITDKVIAENGQAVVRPILPIVVATDHRVNDGADLAAFVNAVADAVAEPLLLLG